MGREEFRENYHEEYPDEPRTDQAMARFNEKLEAIDPLLAQEFARMQSGAKDASQASWLTESQVVKSRDRPPSEWFDVSQLAQGSATHRFMAAFKEAMTDEWTPEEKRETAQRIIAEMYRPVTDNMEAQGIYCIHPHRGYEVYDMKTSEDRVAIGWNLSARAASRELEWNDLSGMARELNRMEQYQSDALKMSGDGRIARFEDAAKEALGKRDWKQIAELGNADQAWQAFEAIQGNWSREHMDQLAEEFTNEVWKRAGDSLDEWKDAKRETWTESSDRHMLRYLSGRTNAALMMAAEGARFGDETQFRTGMENVELITEEIKKNLETGEWPKARNDGSRDNDYMFEHLREAAKGSMTPERAAQYIAENGLEKRAETGFSLAAKEKYPELAQRLEDALTGITMPHEANWITEGQTTLVFDSEDESRYHHELRPESDLKKVMETVQGATENRDEMAGDAMEALNAPLTKYIGDSRANYQEILDNAPESGMRDTWTKLAHRCLRMNTQGAEALVYGAEDELVSVSDQMQIAAWDMAKAAPLKSNMNFEQTAERALGEGSNWQDIGLPENAGAAWSAFRELVNEQWSGEYLRETARDLAWSITGFEPDGYDTWPSKAGEVAWDIETALMANQQEKFSDGVTRAIQKREM